MILNQMDTTFKPDIS